MTDGRMGGSENTGRGYELMVLGLEDADWQGIFPATIQSTTWPRYAST